MKRWLVIIGFLFLIGALFFSLKNGNGYKNRWKVSEANVKAYDELLSSSKEKNTAYQLTIDQLNYAKDSVLKKLNETRKQLKIKDKNVKSVQYVTSAFIKTDTITLKDTVFRDKGMRIDTLLGDNWYKAEIKLEYPSTMIVSPSFRSEKSIIVSAKKETVNPPKKFWLFRLFQKKHKVLHVDVVEENPYVQDSESRYVEIIK